MKTPFTTVSRRLVHLDVFLYLLPKATSAFHIFMDIWILVLPVKLIIRIPRQSREKIALFIIFSLRIISTIASIVRLQALRMFTLSNDPFYDSLPINTWSMVEVNIGILCASIPTLKRLVSKAQRFRTQQALYKYNDKKNNSNEWDIGNKPMILRSGKGLIISLHPSTLQSSTRSMDEEGGPDFSPPSPPPKDDDFGALQQAKEYRQAITYPDMTYRTT
jgi:hypothetical protein